MLTPEIIAHSKLLYDSFAAVTGNSLLEGNFTPEELAEKLYEAHFVLL